MSALWYILRKSLKNSLLELLRKPGKLAVYIVILLLMVSVIIMSLFTQTSGDAAQPLFWFTGVLFLYISLFVAFAFYNGLSGGAAIFEMNDVNLLFVSPVPPRKILLYGIGRMAKTAFVAGFFILFQSSTLANFGVNYGGVLLTFAGFLLSVVVLTVVSLLVYSTTNSKPARKRFVKGLAALLFLPVAAYAAARYFTTGDVFAALESAIHSPFVRFFPVAGWTASGVTAFLSGEIWFGLLFFGLNLLLLAGMVAYIMLTNPDYYEDVLVATETAYEKKRAVAEGNIDAAASRKKPVKVTKTGIPGNGAAALFGKHTRESFRQNRFGFLTMPSVIIIAGGIIFSMFVRDLFVTLQVLVWVQIFLIGTGRGLKETYSHYIYMIPESSFKKIIWSNMEIMARTVMENVLIFGVAGLLLRVNIGLVLVYIVAYTLFSFVLLGVNYVSMRFTGADLSGGLVILIYYLAVVLVMLPGVVLAIAAGSAVGGGAGLFTGLLALAGWELAAGTGCFALSRGVLHDCDMAMLKTNK